MKKSVFITTPIYYVNDVPHIGHAYTTIIADTLARFYRLLGHETFFLTGTDEHGQKIEQAASQRGRTPKEYADEISSKFKSLWDEFDISYNHFIRTTDQSHKNGVQKAFEFMYNKGDIYKGTYKGNYCVSCETFFTQSQLIDEQDCPDCGRATSLVEEDSYFFKLSKYEDNLIKWYEDDEKCILPKGKKNEVISFVKQGLKDLSITRTSFDWGIKLPKSLNDDKHVMYVWLDALLNYITALGYGNKEEKMHFWPASFHLVGKDILRFHAIYWPAFLMSLNLPLPKHIGAHGWWTRNGEKMSKSKGNVVDPREVASAYGLENFRYFLLREVPFGQDGDFSQKSLIDRINSELGNELGNLLNRIIGMSQKYNDGYIPKKDVKKFFEKELNDCSSILKESLQLLENLQTNRYLEELWKVLSIANQSITIHEPWTKIKEGKKDEALALVSFVSNLLAKVSLLLSPVMPNTCKQISNSLSFEINTNNFEKLIMQNELLEDFSIKTISPLFPRIEAELMSVPDVVKNIQKEDNKKESTKIDEKIESIISIDQFFMSKLKVGTVLEASKVEKSDRLLKLKVDLGEENPRQIIAGIAQYYQPDEIINTQICVVTNLKPAKIMGLESQGMILAAKDEDGLCLVQPQKNRKNGASIG